MSKALVTQNSKEVEAVVKPKVKLTFLTGDKRGQFFYVGSEDRITIGRSPNCNVTLDDTKVSREHAELVWYNGHLVLTDLKSQNGLIVNDKKVLQSEIEDGDRIIIGKSILKVSFEVSSPRVKQFSKEQFKQEKIKPENNKRQRIYLLGIVLILLYVLFDDDGTTKKHVNRNLSSTVDSASNVISKIERNEKRRSKKLDKKISVVLQRGLRELRERNYFRAISEFDYALDLKPNDSQANFYLRKARDELDQAIQRYNFDAKRDIASLKYDKGIVSYCAIIRLLQKYPEDKRYIDARKNLEELEVNLGYEQGEIICIQE